MAKRKKSLFPSKLFALGATVILLLAFIYVAKAPIHKENAIPDEVTVSDQTRTYFTPQFSLEYPSNWFADPFPNQTKVDHFQVSDVQDAEEKISGKSKTHARIAVQYIPSSMPSCGLYNGTGCEDNKTVQPLSVNGYSGKTGYEDTKLGRKHIAYINNPYDTGGGAGPAYLSLYLLLPEENQELAEKVFSNLVSSVRFINPGQKQLSSGTPISSAVVESEGAHLDLYTKTVGLVMDGATLNINGTSFLKTIQNFSLYSQPIYNSNDGYSYTTLETIWNENNVDMRLYFYFKYKPGENWQLYDLRTYDGQEEGEWLYYNPVDNDGKPIKAPQDGTFETYNLNLNSTNSSGKLRFDSLKIQLFVNQ